MRPHESGQWFLSALLTTLSALLLYSWPHAAKNRGDQIRTGDLLLPRQAR